MTEPFPPTPNYGDSPQYPIESVDNALRVLLLLGEQPKLRLTDVSRYLGVASSTAHRLLAMLLPDPERALSVVTEAERARDAVRRAHSELEERIAELDGATEELVAQGLSRHQVRELLGLTGDEDHGRGAHAAE